RPEPVAGQLEVLARVEQGLAGDAADVEARAAERRVLLHACGLEAELRRADRGHVAAGTRADPDQVEARLAHEGLPPRPACVRGPPGAPSRAPGTSPPRARRSTGGRRRAPRTSWAARRPRRPPRPGASRSCACRGCRPAAGSR